MIGLLMFILMLMLMSEDACGRVMIDDMEKGLVNDKVKIGVFKGVGR